MDHHFYPSGDLRTDAATEEDKVEQMIVFLTEGHIDLHGGYPYDYDWFGDTLVVAGLDDRKERARTGISTYERGALVAWYDRAVAWWDGGADGEAFEDALYNAANGLDIPG